MMALTRQEKEKLVLELYSQGKTYRQIAEEARICPRDIKTILDKVVKGRESEESLSVSSQAYKLFLAGNSPIDVAIALNLRDDQVTELYKEYWNLCHLQDLTQVYEEIKCDIGSFLNLYKLAKAAGMNAQQVIILLAIANNHLPAVEQRCEDLKREVYSIEGDKRNSTMILQELSDLVSTTRGTLEQYESDCEEKRLEITKLQIQRIGAEALVKDFQNNNET
jgi:type II secretory pathway component GspD/PulD (secretin)